MVLLLWSHNENTAAPTYISSSKVLSLLEDVEVLGPIPEAELVGLVTAGSGDGAIVYAAVPAGTVALVTKPPGTAPPVVILLPAGSETAAGTLVVALVTPVVAGTAPVIPDG